MVNAHTKGKRAELELARLLAEATGWPVRRRLQVGRADDTGDLEGVPFTVVQVRDYADPERAIRDGLAPTEAQRLLAEVPYGVLMVRRRGGRWLAVMTPEQFVAVLTDAVAYRRCGYQCPAWSDDQ